MWTRNATVSFPVAWLLVATLGPSTSGQVIYETAEQGPYGQGGITRDLHVGFRFELASPKLLETIGGEFSGPAYVDANLYRLASATDHPLDGFTPILAHASIRPLAYYQAFDGFAKVNPIVLPAGIYAVMYSSTGYAGVSGGVQIGSPDYLYEYNGVYGSTRNTYWRFFLGGTDPLYGDANHDGSVGFDDLVILARNYGTSNATFEHGDFNGDGNVGFDDLTILARNYGQTLTAAQLAQLDPAFRADVEQAFAELPEPSLSALVSIAAVPLLHRPRRC